MICVGYVTKGYHLVLFFFLYLSTVSGQYSDLRNNFFEYDYTQAQCSKIDGSIQKHGTINYVHNGYSANFCWNIVTDKREIFTLRLSGFSKFHDPSCQYLIVEPVSFNSSGEENSNFLETLQFTSKKPVSHVFRATQLKLYLINGCKQQSLSFQLNYTIEENCDSNVELKTYEYISSPEDSLNNIECSWNVSLLPQVDQFSIQFILLSWQLRQPYSEVLLYVYDGPNDTYPLIATINAYWNRDDKIISTGPSMYIKYKTGNGVNHPFKGYVKIKGYCLPGSRPCGDGENCYTEKSACNGRWDCANGYDEKRCESKGCSSSEYWCGVGMDDCYYENQRCDGSLDCSSSRSDEMNCDAESCAPGTFFCPSTKECIYERHRCDGERYCVGSDVDNQCTYTASRRVITAGIVGSLVCGLLLAIALGCSCKLYTLRSAAHMRSRRSRLILPTPLGRIARELLQQEAPPSYNMTVEGVDAGSGRESSRSRSSNRRRRRRRRNREPQIRRAQPSTTTPVSVIGNEQQQNSNRDDALPSAFQSTSSTRLTQRNETSLNSLPTDNDVVLLLAEIGLVDFPSESRGSAQSDSTVASSETPSTSNIAVDQPHSEAEAPPTDESSQAPPLPKKKRIRPVFVEAPYDDVIVGDIPGCVYPNPPAYSEVVTTPAPETVAVSPNLPENNVSPSHKPEPTSQPFYKKLWAKHNSKNVWKLPSSLHNIFSINSSSPAYHELGDTADSDSRINDESASLDSCILDISDSIEEQSPSSAGSSASSNYPEPEQQVNDAESIRPDNSEAFGNLLELRETSQSSVDVCPQQNPENVESCLSLSAGNSAPPHSQ